MFTQLQLQRASCDIKCGWSHVLVLDTNGEVWSWGKGTEGQLGRGKFTSSNVPSRIETLSQVKTHCLWFVSFFTW